MFKPHASCNLCSLPEELLKDVHYWRFIENMPVQKIASRLNDVAPKYGINKKFYPAAVNNHFKKHLPPEMVAAYIQKIPPNLLRGVSSVPVEKIVSVENHLAAAIAPENFEVFERLRNSMEELTNHVEALNSILPKKDSIKEKDPEELILDLKYTYDVYIRLMKELRATLNDVSGFLNLKSVLRTFVEELLREYTHRVVSAFLDEMRYLKSELSLEGDQVATIVMKEVSTSFASKLANVTDQIIDRFDRLLKSQNIR